MKFAEHFCETCVTLTIDIFMESAAISLHEIQYAVEMNIELTFLHEEKVSSIFIIICDVS